MVIIQTSHKTKMKHTDNAYQILSKSQHPVRRKPSFLKAAIIINIQTQNAVERNNIKVAGLRGEV